MAFSGLNDVEPYDTVSMMPEIGAYSYAPSNVLSRVSDMDQAQVTLQDFVLPEYLDYTAGTSSLDMNSVPSECFPLSFRGPPSPPDEDEVEQRLARSRHSPPQDSLDCRGLGALNIQPHSQPTVSPGLPPDDAHDKSKARKDPRYSAPPDKDGFFRCPLVEHSGCTHKPTKQRCIYAKYLDSHLRPYKCKNPACIAEGDDARFSSNACLFRHEREAHGMHCHGMNPYLCKFPNCPRSRPDNGFPRSWNQRDHMKRVHQWVPEKGDEDGASGCPAPEPKRRKGTSVPSSVPMKRSDSSRFARATGLSRYPRDTRRSVSSRPLVETYRPVPVDKVMVYDPSMSDLEFSQYQAAELIIITGLPCAGKTHRAQQLAEYLTHRIASDPSSAKRTVVTVSSHHASLDASSSVEKPTRLRDQVYNSAAQEKTARAEEFSAIKRALSKDCVVVADSLNYIKGYRYQLWCEAKAAATRCCVVHAAASEHQCRQWNEERLIAWGRHDEVDSSRETGQNDTSHAGKDVPGDLVPESHTALYGDRDTSGHDSRSRSSSVDGNAGDDTGNDNGSPAPAVTLTSLSISSPPAASATPPPSASPPYNPSTLSSLIMRYEPPSPFTRWDTPLQARELGMADGDGGTLTLSVVVWFDTDELTIPSGTVLSQPMLQRLRRKYTQIQRTSISHGQGYAGQTDGRRGVVDSFVQFMRLEFQGSSSD
ncbi:hypothetical protein DV738_g345, partial [Chaetothyriales sp. CBS 135597]